MDKENIKRVDNRPASVYSIIIFAFVFTMCYIFYPQISMVLPFLGEKVTKTTSYVSCGVADMLDAEYIVVARADSIEKAQIQNSGNNGEVYKNVEFTCLNMLKGNAGEKFTLRSWGGEVLAKQGARTKKYIVTYSDAAEFKKGKTYLLFIDEHLEVLNGKYGALEMNDDGTFEDFSGKNYAQEDIIALIKGAHQ